MYSRERKERAKKDGFVCIKFLKNSRQNKAPF
jgi:hypothetical protein